MAIDLQALAKQILGIVIPHAEAAGMPYLFHNDATPEQELAAHNWKYPITTKTIIPTGSNLLEDSFGGPRKIVANSPQADPIGQTLQKALIGAQNFVQNAPLANFSGNAHNPIDHALAQLAEQQVNIPSNALRASGDIGNMINGQQPASLGRVASDAFTAAQLPLALGAYGGLAQKGLQALHAGGEAGFINPQAPIGEQTGQMMQNSAGKTIGQLQQESQRAHGLKLLSEFDRATKTVAKTGDYSKLADVAFRILSSPDHSPIAQYKPVIQRSLELIPQLGKSMGILPNFAP